MYDALDVPGGPKFGDICLVEGVETMCHPLTGASFEMLVLAGWRDPLGVPRWSADGFRPLDGDEFERLRAICAGVEGRAKVREAA